MSGKGSREARRKRMLQIGSAAVFLAIVAVAVLIVVSQSQTSGGDTNLEDVALVSRELSSIPQSGMVLGDPQAKVKLTEFGDLKCPVCKGFSEEIIPDVIDSKVRGGEAKIEFKNYTIIDRESTPAGAAAIAAGEQGRAWSFIELFYRNQGLETASYATGEFLTEIARGAGVPDIGKWNEARKSKLVLGLVQRTTEEAEGLGFTGTPSFGVEGPGTTGMETLGTPGSAGAIEEAIEEAG